MEIPYQALPSATLTNLIEELVTRDGTDYGDNEFSLEEKVAQVKRKLICGEAVILYHEATELCEIVIKEA